MLPTRRMCLGDVNPHLLCVLCGGYFVDATTIIECLHSFCRTCIVKFLETSKYCPICDVQVHKTRPLQNIRSDQTLQDIVYKLVPGLFHNEMRARRDFYGGNKEAVPSNKEDAGEVTDACYIYTADEPVSLSLQYSGKQDSEHDIGRRYLRCPAAVTVAHLQKLLRAKHDLTMEHRVDICHEADAEPLSNNFTLMDVAYIHQWKRKGPMHFHYQIYEHPNKRRRLDEDVTSEKVSEAQTIPAVAQENKIQDKEEEWKEVQLQISETGIMKVTNLDLLAATETIISSGRIDNPCPSDAEKATQNKSDINGNSKDKDSSVTKVQETNNQADATVKKESPKEVEVKKEPKKDSTVKSDIKLESISKKDKDAVPKPSTASVSVPNVLSSVSITPEPHKILKKLTELKEQKAASCSSQASSSKIKEEVAKQVIKEKKKELPSDFSKSLLPSLPPPSPTLKKSTSTCVGYKTLKTPPKSWNPSVSRGSYLSSHSTLSKSQPHIAPKPESHSSETSRTNVPVQNKAPRFFKERDRPRFLGNPLSGVKPMYPIQADRTPPVSNSSMIKIDPKTLSPMSSKAHNNNHISCNSITTATGTITTSVASKRSMKDNAILHPPPNPLLYNYSALINSPLIRPLMNPNVAHQFAPYPMPQAMFYGSQLSPPTVQRVPANVNNSQKSPIAPISESQSPKTEIVKVNGDLPEKQEKSNEKLGKEMVKPSAGNKDTVNNNNNNNDANKQRNTPATSTSCSSAPTAPVAPKVAAVESTEPSKCVPPQASK